MLSLLPGVEVENLKLAMTHIQNEAQSVIGAGGGPPAVADAYLRWVDNGVRRLRNMVSREDCTRLLLTETYWTVLRAAQTAVPTQPLRAAVERELERSIAEWELEAAELEARVRSWADTGVFVVADTSVFIHGDKKLKDLDIAALVGAGDASIRLLVPILVVDELDGLKRRGDNRGRWRAAHSLAVIEDVVGTGLTGTLREPDFSGLDVVGGHPPRRRVTLEVVLDPPGHQRRLVSDDEIVARATSFRPFAGRRPVKFLTMDTGQTLRSRAARLDTRKVVEEPLGDEPPRSSGHKRTTGG